MSFDPRSLERLRELGRSLPQPLPKPDPNPSPRARGTEPGQSDGSRASAAPSEPRHRVETETDPEQLFRELMQASVDGTVPPHLMERLRQLEGERRQRRAAAGGDHGHAQGDGAPPSTDAASAGPPGRRGKPQAPIGRPDPRLAAAHGDLYTAFQQLLLEDDELD